MATVVKPLQGSFLPNGNAVWAIVPALAAVGAWMAAPPSTFDRLSAMAFVPTTASADVRPMDVRASDEPSGREFALAVDPPLDGASGPAANSPMGFEVGQPRRYHVDYTVFGSSNRASYDVYVDGIERIEDRPYYKVVTVLTGTPRDRSEVMHYRASEQGVHRRFTFKDKTYEALWYPAPFKVGHKWSQDVDGLKHEGVYEAIERIEVNGEKLTCLRVTLDGTLGRSTEWLCPGRGVVKVSQKSRLYSADVAVDRSAPVPPRESIALNE